MCVAPGFSRRASHDRGDLLVTRQDDADLVGIGEGRVQGERLFTGDAEHVLHALVLEAADKELGDVQRSASPTRRSTMTVSRHSPSSLACRRYVPTSRKPTRASNLRLGWFSGKTRDTSLCRPRRSHAATSASIAARPAPAPRWALST